MTERPVFIDPVSHFGDEVGDGRVPRWYSFVAVLVLAASAFYGFSYVEGPSLDSPHTFREGVGVEVPAETSTGSGH
ncbi:MAG TPA: hypothetical protein VNA14_01980 [Mycobacteriales bacterium]|nr:hypothetical protein [Mycobacteriales bacterium]